MAHSGRSGKITAIELVFILGIAFMVVATIVPQAFRVRDSVRVELAARQLERCDTAADGWMYGGAAYTNRVTLAEIDDSIAQAGKDPLVWPSAARMDTFEKKGGYPASIVVFVRDGERTVTAADLEGVNHAN